MSGNPMRRLLIGTTIVFLTLAGCATAPIELPPAPRIEAVTAQTPAGLSRTRAAVVRTAAKFVGTTTLQSNGRRIAYDCAGVTRAIFLEHGIDLYSDSTNDPKANGVRLIFTHVRRHGTLHQDPVAHPGDLVFFDNTWDFNGDGRLNDPLTHVGVVERVDPDGTVTFISRVAESVERYRMNLALPHVHKTTDGRVLNDYIRRVQPRDPGDMGHLTGELFTFYGARLDP